MALTGLQIFKLLPKTNCKECGFPTCLAFAMGLAGKKVALDKCPHVSDEAKEALEGASAPPVRLIKFGVGDAEFAVGNETVLFRHEESFYRPTGIAVVVSDKLDDAALDAKLSQIKSWTFDRVGMEIAVNLAAVRNDSGDADALVKAAKAAAEKSGRAVMLMSDNADNLKAAAEAIKDQKPLLYAATPDNVDAVAAVAKDCGCPVVAKADGVAGLQELTGKLTAAGVQDIVLDSGARELAAVLNDLTQIRRQALKKSNRALGYPAVAFAVDADPLLAAAEASAYIAKYAGIVVVDADQPWEILPLLTLRQNVYTDPRKPIMVEAKVYEVGGPDENSPVLSTTNFSLTYFTVEGEVEASKVPAWIVVSDTEGMSVLTAWAADKYNPENIAKAIKEMGVEGKVNHKKLVIPGYVAVLSGELEEETGWNVLVGPREASGLPAYLKMWAEGKL